MSDLSMTRVDSNSYRGFKKHISGKVHYLGADEAAARVKLLTILLEQASGQKVFLGEPPPVAVVDPTTLYQVIEQYQQHVRGLAVSDTWKLTVCHRVKTLKRYIADLPLAKIDYDQLTRMANLILARPTTTRGTPMSAETAVNLVKALRGLMQWLDASGRWVGFRRWEKCLTIRNKMKRRGSYGQIKMLTLTEFATAFHAASDRMRCYMLLALNTGMTQTELSTLTPDHVDLENARISRNRHKTGVWSSWVLWPKTLSLLTGEMQYTGPVAFVTEQGKRLVHFNGGTKTDSVRQAWTRLVEKTGIRTGLGFKSIRKLGGQLLREAAGLEISQLYLAHTGGSVAEQHYTNPVYAKLDTALINLGTKVEAALTSPASNMRVVEAPATAAELRKAG